MSKQHSITQFFWTGEPVSKKDAWFFLKQSISYYDSCVRNSKLAEHKRKWLDLKREYVLEFYHVVALSDSETYSLPVKFRMNIWR